MVRYECDSCHDFKAAGEEWILGLAAENIGAVSARREIALEPEWDDETATHPLAVHLCSVECQERYMAALFGNPAKPRASVAPIAKRTRSARAQRTRKRAS
jgi:hypothetical protein